MGYQSTIQRVWWGQQSRFIGPRILNNYLVAESREDWQSRWLGMDVHSIGFALKWCEFNINDLLLHYFGGFLFSSKVMWNRMVRNVRICNLYKTGRAIFYVGMRTHSTTFDKLHEARSWQFPLILIIPAFHSGKWRLFIVRICLYNPHRNKSNDRKKVTDLFLGLPTRCWQLVRLIYGHHETK